MQHSVLIKDTIESRYRAKNGATADIDPDVAVVKRPCSICGRRLQERLKAGVESGSA